jgi:tRNA A37 N6-isopentenylltransferase MiaA
MARSSCSKNQVVSVDVVIKSRLLQNNTQRISKIDEIFFEQIILEDKKR